MGSISQFLAKLKHLGTLDINNWGGDLLDSLTITGDTIFNNLSWKKGVYHSHLLEGYSCYIAEDTTTGEIWYSKNIDTNYNSSQNFFYTTKKKYLPFASQIFNYTL